MKVWQGRLKDLDSSMNDFNASLPFDSRMYREDIEGSIAHVKMLGACSVIESSAAERIGEALLGILSDLDSGILEIDPSAEDIHSFVEQELAKRIGEDGKRLHTARSRNDQVALDMRLYFKKQAKATKANALGLMEALIALAEDNTQTLMPGYTHLQHAQPVSFAHALMAYAQMLKRDVTRLDDCLIRMDEMPLGAGALAGTTYPIDRRMVADMLGFSKLCGNSLDAVSDRDFLLELIFCCAGMMMHLSRLCEDIILWCTSEFGFLELSDSFSTGSSIMPQKKNPDLAELVRGKTGRVYGDLMALFTAMKGLPLSYNKDLQEDKEAAFDALDTVNASLKAVAGMIATCTPKKDAMKSAAQKGYMNATDCADYLVKKGVPFRDAYRVTGALVNRAIELGKNLEELPFSEFAAASNVFDEGVYAEIDPVSCMEKRNVPGGPAPGAVKEQIRALKSFLKEE